MIRDRLAELRKAQDDLDEGATVELKVEITAEEASRNRFFSQIEEVTEGIRKIEAAVNQVRKKHSEILSSTDSDDGIKKELDDLMADIKRTGAKVNAKLKEIAPQDVDKEDRFGADIRIRRSQHAAATRQFVEAMTQYHHVQEEYRDKCKDKIHRQLRITGKDPTEEELDEMLEKNNIDIFTQGIMMETAQERQRLADIEERHQEIMKLENSLRELHDLFMDVAVLVQSQGETIDNIAAHVCSAKDFVEDAKVETSQALQYQKSARKKMIICGIIGVVIVVILLVVIIVSV
ncbi:syntaxin-like [Portunus trituberculatus]|uniref:syntaxin-like n=1 Tax=Portunus trituberculatus TaxID=210409 RepID=UPI001E1D1CD7|nr:syntaxin-like [Portunus trituberculatus]